MKLELTQSEIECLNAAIHFYKKIIKYEMPQIYKILEDIEQKIEGE
jgi:hypothetical protein